MDVAAVNGWPASFFVEAGRTAHASSVAGIGVRWPWPWQASRWGGVFTAGTETALHHWLVPGAAGPVHATQVTLVPMLRWRPAQGGSRWFVEGGIGLSVHDRQYVVGTRVHSSRWNFEDVLTLGRTIGAQPGHELSLRLSHISNASLRQPNPGEDRITLRWSFPF